MQMEKPKASINVGNEKMPNKIAETITYEKESTLPASVVEENEAFVATKRVGEGHFVCKRQKTECR